MGEGKRTGKSMLQREAAALGRGLCLLGRKSPWTPLIGQHYSRESLVIAAGPEVSHNATMPGLAVF